MKIKPVVLFLLLAVAGVACQGKADKNNQTKDQKGDNEMGTIHLTKAEFLSKVANYEGSPTEWKYLGDKPCIVDFYADWCGPCKAVAPILEELAKEYAGKIVIYKVNTDQEPDLSAAFGIRSIPSFLFCPMTGKPQMTSGAMSKADFKKAIDDLLLKSSK